MPAEVLNYANGNAFYNIAVNVVIFNLRPNGKVKNITSLLFKTT